MFIALEEGLTYPNSAPPGQLWSLDCKTYLQTSIWGQRAVLKDMLWRALGAGLINGG